MTGTKKAAAHVPQSLAREFKASRTRIICAALLDRASGALVVGPRHFDATMQQAIACRPWIDWKRAEQGFIDQMGCFYDRRGAYAIARERGQIVRELPSKGELLYSEHLC